MIFVDQTFAHSIFKPRKSDSSKWDFGHAMILAGSSGKAGAAILAAKACLRTGAGLLTVHVPSNLETALQVALPEAMISLDADQAKWTNVPDLKYKNAIGIGPGIGKDGRTAKAFTKLLGEIDIPLVIDADALNILSMCPELQDQFPPTTVLTPHHREFARLIGKTWNYENELESFAMSYSLEKGVVLVLKSSRTKIYVPDGHVYLNSTGNAGLAKGGTGDILTGIITSLLAQGYKADEASVLGCYLHGRAAELAVKEITEESLLASDVIQQLSYAIKEIKVN